jgi:Ni,Fe-hydrogenase I small subunit
VADRDPLSSMRRSAVAVECRRLGETGKRFTVLWLQAGSCGGCSMALIDHGRRGLFAELDAFGIDLLWHPSLSEATGREVVALLEGIEEIGRASCRERVS